MSAVSPSVFEGTLAEQFVDQALLTPDRLALRSCGADVSFAQLDRWSDEVARSMRSAGVREGHVVGICVGRSPAVMAAVLGLLKVGAAYVALDPETPVHRRRRILADANPEAVLCAPDLYGLLDLNIPRIGLPPDSVDSGRREHCAHVSDDALFHLVYTSGTTGRPKGVRVKHGSVRNRLEWMWRTYPFSRDSVMCIQKSYALVASPWEMLGGLLRGIPSVLLTREQVLDPSQLYSAVEREHITDMFLSPPLIESIVDEHERQGGDLALRLVTSSADVLPVKLVRRFNRTFPGVTLLNLYGMTECSSNVAAFDTKQLNSEAIRVPVGRPIGGAVIRVVDAANRTLPVGVQGQIVISGPAVADGYHGDLELTKRCFRHDENGNVWYQTGDYGRWLRSGDLELTGRVDNQVQVRGFRVELEEVELALRTVPGVAAAAVVLGCQNEQTTLIAFCCGEDVDDSSLRPTLLEQLPEFMVPTKFIKLASLPTSDGGKVDRLLLASLAEKANLAEKVESPPPSFADFTATEQRIANLWQDILGAPPLSAEANFFNAGGHSLLAVRLVSRMRAEFSRPVPLSLIFQNATLRSLAAAMETTERQGSASVPTLVPQVRGRVLPLSYAQERLWFLDQLGLVGPAYNVPLSLKLQGKLDVRALERSLGELIRRHEILRTRFGSISGSPVQLIDPPAPFALDTRDLSGLQEKIKAAQLVQLSSTEARRPFDLANGLLLRALLLKLAFQDHVLLLTMHHIITDGWSLKVLNGELSELYAAYAKEQPSPLSELPVQYADYSIWQRQWMQGDVLQKQLRYWSERLAGAPSQLQLPTDRPRPAVASFKGALLTFELPAALCSALQKLARDEGATWFMVFLAAYQLLLSRYSGQQDVVVGSAIAGRADAQTEELIGFFLNTLTLRTDLTGKPSFRQLLARVKEGALGAYAHQDLPFEKLVMELRPERNLTHQPIFQVALAQNLPQERSTLGELTWTWSTAEQGTALFDLTLYLTELSDGLRASFEYATDLFDEGTIERMAVHFRALLDGIVTEPDRPIQQLQLMGEIERQQVLHWSGMHEVLPPAIDVIAILESHARSKPDAEAVRAGDQRLTYRELNVCANRLSRRLRDLGVRPGDRVGVYMRGGGELLIAFYALLKTGAVYVPLDPIHPQERLNYICRDAEVRFVIVRKNEPIALDALGLSSIEVDAASVLATDEADHNPADTIDPASAAYAIYTSGSTGEPKGVLLPRDGLSNVVAAQRNAFALTASDRIVQLASTSFDASVFEFVLALGPCACLVLGSREEHLSGESLASFLRTHSISVMTITPSALSLLSPDDVPSVRVVISAGEDLPAALTREWLTYSRVFNAYGPTEATIWATTHECTEETTFGRVPIGRPIDRTRIYLLDTELRPVAIGEPGELCVAGPGVALEYIKRPDLTADRFVDDPNCGPGRMYRTGDLARWRSDGTVEILGRSDRQVKIRGYRIEPAEIEQVVLAHPAVRQVAVLACEDEAGERRLVSYVVGDRSAVLNAGSDGSAAKLRREMVRGWETLYNDVYRAQGQVDHPSFVGWISADTGQPIPEGQMQEWLACTIERISALRPRKVLEIGCGVGLLLDRLAPQCAVYVGTDLSTSALGQITQWMDRREDLRHVQLLHRPATELRDLKSNSFDTLILNSVVQYFPDVEYLLTVLKDAVRLLVPGGRIVIGDVRNLRLLAMQHSAMQLNKAAATISVGQLRRRIARAMAQERELVIDPQFFHQLPERLPEIIAVDVQLKRGRASNELTRYRYDVVLQIGEQVGGAQAPCQSLQWTAAVGSYGELGVALAERRWPAVRLVSIPNSRLVREAATQELIEASDERLEVGMLRRRLSELQLEGFDPEEFWRLGDAHGYDVQVNPGSEDLMACLDVQLLYRARTYEVPRDAVQPPHQGTPVSSYANDPLENSVREQLVPQLREYLKRRLPEYMVPSAWMVLKQLPLTPSGKLDRRALPVFQSQSEGTGEYIPPSTNLERKLAAIWAQVLRIDQVGVQDDFFELGGHSLLASRLIGQIAEDLSVQFQMQALFQNPTVQQMARFLESVMLLDQGQPAPTDIKYEEGVV